MFDNINIPTIIISFSSSIIISLFTFILGLRAGKNQNDRQRLKQIYKDIYVYFCNILEGLKENEPVRWSDYKTVFKKDKGYYLTPLKEKNGELVELYNKEIRVLLQNEIAYLRYGYELSNKVFPLINSLILEGVNKQFKIDGFLQDNTSNYSFYIENRPNGSYTPISVNPKVFLSDDNFDKIISKENKDSLYYSFNFSINDKNKTIYIESRLINEPTELFTSIFHRVKSDDYIKSIYIRKNDLIKKCNKDLRFLRRRIKEPHTVVNTVLNSFIDIFRM